MMNVREQALEVWLRFRRVGTEAFLGNEKIAAPPVTAGPVSSATTRRC
jgi:hypothetical protein